MDVTILHNPACGTSRNVLAILREAGIEPTIRLYLEQPLDRAELDALVAKLGVPVRDLLREKGTPFAALGLGDQALSDAPLLDAIVAHPILLNRPIVITDKGAKLCRPSETVRELI